MLADNGLTPENISGFFVQFPYQGFQLTLQELAKLTGVTASSQIKKQLTNIRGQHVQVLCTIELTLTVPETPAAAARAGAGGDEDSDEDLALANEGSVRATGSKRRHGDFASAPAPGDSHMV